MKARRKPTAKTEASDRTAEKKALLDDVRVAVQQIGAGRGVADEDAKAELRKRFGR